MSKITADEIGLAFVFLMGIITVCMILRDTYRLGGYSAPKKKTEEDS